MAKPQHPTRFWADSSELPALYLADEKGPPDRAAKRYEQENCFIEMVAQGRPENALEEWERLRKMPSEGSYAVPVSLSTGIASATALRTLLRKAAERGKLHPMVVDALSRAYAQKMYMVRDVRELGAMIPEMITTFAQAVRDSRQKRMSAAVVQAVSYVELHLSQELTVKELAGALRVAPGSFGRRFKAETGETLAHYVTKRRCAKAAVLLTNSARTVQDIGAAVGYFDNNYFTKVFKSVYGLSPSDFRKGGGANQGDDGFLL